MMAFPIQENHVTISLSLRSNKEKWELLRKLQSELDLVRNWVKKIEWKDGKLNGVVDSVGAKSTNSGVASLDPPNEPKASRPLQQFSSSMLENSSQGFSDNTGKEKRAAKGNLLYRNSEASLAKDKLPQERKKNLKTSESTHEPGSGKFSSHTLKNCVTLLDRLMKHKHGWVFNEPVDPKNLGLTDYFDIIKFPMDLCTVKNRLNRSWYKSPREFAEDVRLTFSNALTYNPKGQDVHSMAEQLSELFENKWAVIEADNKLDDCEVGLPTSKSRTAPLLQSPLPKMIRTLERSESTTDLIDPKSNIKNLSHSNRKPATKKKNETKFLSKRDMTYQEKEKLSMNLQNLPSDKLDNVVQILKRRAPSLCHNDDEIEVDIDSFDTETLWELDWFVTNYHKSLSKNKRKAVQSIQCREETEQNAHKMVPPVIVAEESEVAKLGHEEKQREKRCRLSSSSSSSKSESSSSDSDKESFPE